MITALKNVHIFDGENIIDDKLILIDGERILSVGGEIPAGATIIDAHNATQHPYSIFTSNRPPAGLKTSFL